MIKSNQTTIEKNNSLVTQPQEYGHLEIAKFGKVYMTDPDTMMMVDFYFLHFGGPLKYSKEIEAAKAIVRYIALEMVRLKDNEEVNKVRCSEYLQVDKFGQIELAAFGEFKVSGFHLKSKEETKGQVVDMPQYIAVLLAAGEYLEKEIKENCEKADAVQQLND